MELLPSLLLPPLTPAQARCPPQVGQAQLRERFVHGVQQGHHVINLQKKRSVGTRTLSILRVWC